MSQVSVIEVVPSSTGRSGSSDSEKGGGAGNIEGGGAVEKSNQRPVVSQKMRIHSPGVDRVKPWSSVRINLSWWSGGL